MTRVEYSHWLKQARFVAIQVAPAHLVEDMAAEGLASLVTSLRTFDPARQVSLGAYVLQRMRWAILDAMRAHRAGSRADSARGLFYVDVPIDEARDAALLPAVDTDRIDLARAIEQLPPKRRRFMASYLRLGDVALASAEVEMSTECGWQHHFQAVRAMRKAMSD